MPISGTPSTWKWRLLLPNGNVTYTDYPAGEFPTAAGWTRVDTSGEPTEFNSWDYGLEVGRVDAAVVPNDNINVDIHHVTDKVITTHQARATGMYALNIRPRFSQSVTFIRSTSVGIISPMKYKFKWPVAMED
jgi:hypothetical protein